MTVEYDRWDRILILGGARRAARDQVMSDEQEGFGSLLMLVGRLHGYRAEGAPRLCEFGAVQGGDLWGIGFTREKCLADAARWITASGEGGLSINDLSIVELSVNAVGWIEDHGGYAFMEAVERHPNGIYDLREGVSWERDLGVWECDVCGELSWCLLFEDCCEKGSIGYRERS